MDSYATARGSIPSGNGVLPSFTSFARGASSLNRPPLSIFLRGAVFYRSKIICMVISSNLSGDTACSFYFTFVTITFTEFKPVTSETNESLFHKRFMFSIFVKISIPELTMHPISSGSRSHRKFLLFFKERVFITFFLSREK